MMRMPACRSAKNSAAGAPRRIVSMLCDDEAGAGTGVSCEVDRFGGEDLADYFRLPALNKPDNRLLPGSMNGCRESCGGMIQREEKR